MSDEHERTIDSVSRRTVLKTGTAAVGTAAFGATAAAGSEDVDEPDGFDVEILGGHAPFPDDLAAQFRLKFAEESRGTIVNNLNDTSTLVTAKVDWAPGGSSGWHYHPGVVLIHMVDGEIEVTWERDCIPRTYEKGDAWYDPGMVHNADNASDEDQAQAYVMFLGIPDGEPATIWVEPRDC